MLIKKASHKSVGLILACRAPAFGGTGKTRIVYLTRSFDIWYEFSNTDDDLPASIIYNDWIELMRLSNIY